MAPPTPSRSQRTSPKGMASRRLSISVSFSDSWRRMCSMAVQGMGVNLRASSALDIQVLYSVRYWLWGSAMGVCGVNVYVPIALVWTCSSSSLESPSFRLGGEWGRSIRRKWSPSQISSVPPGFNTRRYSSMRFCCWRSVLGVTRLRSLIMMRLNSSFGNGRGVLRRSCCTNRQFISSASIRGASGAISIPVNEIEENPLFE